MRSKTCIFCLIAFIALAVSCASRLQRRVDRKNDARAQNIDLVIQSLVKKGNYIDAVTLTRDVDKRLVPTIQNGSSYTAAVNGLISTGMNYYSEGDIKQAGNTFKCAIDHMSSDTSMQSKYIKTSEQISLLLISCEDKMMNQGLVQYRSGNLENAIEIWEDILKLNPDHAEARKALRTASIQLKNLEKIENE